MLSQEGLRRLLHHAGIHRERQPCSSPGLCKGSALTGAGVTGGITRSQPRGLVGRSHFGKSTVIRDPDAPVCPKVLQVQRPDLLGAKEACSPRAHS